MKKTMDYILADPAGNTTILVLTETNRADYAAVARQLLAKCPTAEQVGFVHEGFMDMCGLEFCGNASRAYAALLALQSGRLRQTLSVQVSGCDTPLQAIVDMEDAGARRGTSFIQMPLPQEVCDLTLPLPRGQQRLAERLWADGIAASGRLVQIDGISHLVMQGCRPGAAQAAGRAALKDLFLAIRDSLPRMGGMEGLDLPAFGLMLLEEDGRTLTPIVYVRDVDTVYFEGSCGSGSAAAACALAIQDADAEQAGAAAQTYTLCQPAGSLQVTVNTEKGEICGLRMGGDIHLSQVQQTQIEVTDE